MKKLILICCLVVLCFGSRRGRYHDLSKNLVAHWKMNDTAATDVVLDTTGNHNGTFTDATGTATAAAHTIAGRINSALDFDGTDDYIEIANHADFVFGDGSSDLPFSVSAWVYMTNRTFFQVVGKWGQDVEEWRVDTGSTLGAGKFYLQCHDSNNDVDIQAYTNTAFSTDQWYHVVATYDSSESEFGINIYVNGQKQSVGSTTLGGTYTAMSDYGEPVRIGYADTRYADGLIDNVMIFNKELSAEDVKFLYNGGEGTERLSSYRN